MNNNPRIKDCISCSRKNVYVLLNGKCMVCFSPAPAYKAERNLRIAEDFKSLTCTQVAEKYKITPQRVSQIISKITKRLGLSAKNIKREKSRLGAIRAIKRKNTLFKLPT